MDYYYYRNDNSDSGGGILIILFILIYPFLPFILVGYELSVFMFENIRLYNYLGGALGALVGLLFYRYFSGYVKSKILYIILVYTISTILILFLKQIGLENEFLEFFLKIAQKLVNWLLSNS